jgi:hypothetical protein
MNDPACVTPTNEEFVEEVFLVVYGDEREPTPRGVGTRNVGIIGAPDSGCSVVAERMSSVKDYNGS